MHLLRTIIPHRIVTFDIVINIIRVMVVGSDAGYKVSAYVKNIYN